MKKIMFTTIMSLLSYFGYSQLACEGFEGTFPPPGWGVYQNEFGPNQTWAQNDPINPNQVAFEGTRAAYLERENVATGMPQDWLVTPAITAPNNAQLRFHSKLSINGDQGSVYRVMVSTSATQSDLASYQLVEEWTELEINPTQQAYNEVVVQLPATYYNQTVHIAFVMLGDFSDRWLIDRVCLTEQCLDPTDLTANNITQESAQLSWTNNSGATQWEIEILPVTEAATGNGITHNGPATYDATGLLPDTDYKYYVKAICSNGAESEWEGPFNFSTVSPGANCNAPFVVTSLPFTDVDNTMNFGNDYAGSPGNSCGTTNAYLDGDDVVYAYTPTVNQVISITLSDLTDTYAGMFVYTSCADIGTNCYAGGFNEFSTDDIAIESMAVTAGTTYYILVSTWPWPNNVGYEINIQVENCAKPTNLSATGATTSSVNLAWTEAGTATSWEYVMQPVGTGLPAGSGTTVASTSVPVTGLPASTGYEVYVRSNCGDGTFSSWTGPVVFNTLCEALPVPFFEGFNTASPTEFCWTVVDANADQETWDMNNNFNPFEGDQAAVLYTDFFFGAVDDWLISPTITLTGNQRLKYRFRVESSFEPNNFEVLLSTTGIDAADFTQVLVPVAEYGNTNYIEVIVNLVNGNIPITGPVNIAWHVPGGGPDGWRLYVDNVIIEEIPSCPDPTNLLATNMTESSGTLSWTPGFNETAWDVVVQPQGTGEPTGSGVAVTGTPSYAMTGLNPSTNYEYYVRAHCADDDLSNWVGPYTFMTTQIPATLNFTDDFEAPATNWTLSNGTEANAWIVGTAVSNGGAQSLYISNNGADNAYTDNVYTVAHAYRDIQMPATVDQISISYDWRALAESCCDYLNVYVVPTSYNPTPGQEIPQNATNIQISGFMNAAADWTTENHVFDASDYQGEIIRLVYEWKSDWSVGGPYPAAIDNVIVNVITCPSPSDLAASNITLTEATVSWNGPTSVTPTYDYYLSTDNDAPDAATAPTGNVGTETVNLTNLTESTIYYIWVRSNCGTADGNSFWVGPLEFHTQCGPFTVPFFEGFDSTSSSEFCWTVTDANNDNDTWSTDYTFNQYEGDEVAAIDTDFNFGANDDYLISPTIILTGNERIKFRYRVFSSFEPNDMEVLLSTTGTNPASFTTVVVPLTTYSNDEYQQSITNLTGISGPVNFAFRIPPGGADGWVMFIDNVIVEQIPLCPEPANIEVSCLSSEGANFTWTAGGTETSWEVAVVESGDPVPSTGTVVNETLYYAMDLNAETAYNFYVRAICPDGSVGAWESVNFTTPTTSVVDANAFCASDNPDQSIVFDNTWGGQVQDYGPVACLFSTPNPVWYYLQVDNPGDLNFQLIQNTAFDANGNPIGTGLDVDFVAYGPFSSLNEACGEIVLEQCDGCPNNTADPNYYPVGNIVDCSYDGAFIENFSIPNAQTGEIYAVLITNFNGSQGQIKLQQLDTSTGSTDCNILYQVALGEDQILCGATETTITAEVTTPGSSQNPTYEWSKDGVVFTPNIVTTGDLSQTITITESGVYSVVIEVENASNTAPITDEVVITFGPAVNAVAPQQFVVCDDEDNNGIGVFNLNSLNAEILGAHSATDFAVNYFATQADANAGTNAIANPAAYNNTTPAAQTIYAAVSSIAVPTCFDVVAVELIVKPLPITNMPPNYTVCQGEQVVIIGEPANYDLEEATYMWFYNGSPINDETTTTLTVNESGVYTLQVTLNGCTNNAETEVIITPAPAFSLGGPYVVCDPSAAIVSVSSENFDVNNAQYSWTLDGVATGLTGASIVASAFGTYEVTVSVNGCTATQSIPVTEDTGGVAFNINQDCIENVYTLIVEPVMNSFEPADARYTWTGPVGFTAPEANLLGASSIEPTLPGLYTVTFVTPNGCVGIDEFTVLSTSCNIQKGISPGDGEKNDFFDLSSLDVINLSIFNRYGQEVYTFANYTKEWGGQDKHGNELPTGTYFYSIERANGETKTGWVYINRQN